MLDTRSVEWSVGSGAVSEKEPGLKELLAHVLESVGCYDACIREAEMDGDFEVADFLRELRRQDLLRARVVVGLLGRAGAA